MIATSGIYYLACGAARLLPARQDNIFVLYRDPLLYSYSMRNWHFTDWKIPFLEILNKVVHQPVPRVELLRFSLSGGRQRHLDNAWTCPIRGLSQAYGWCGCVFLIVERVPNLLYIFFWPPTILFLPMKQYFFISRGWNGKSAALLFFQHLFSLYTLLVPLALR